MSLPPKIEGYLEGLNEQQRAVACHGQGPALCLAVPGSGKTTTITRRLGVLVDYFNVPPYLITGITFTNKAARVMRDRAAALLGDRASQIRLKTFHSLGVQILRNWASLIGRTENFSVLDERDSGSLMRRAMRACGHNDASERDPLSILVATEISKAKTLYWDADEIKKNLNEISANVYEAYEGELKASDAFDFADLLGKQLVLFDRNTECLEQLHKGMEVLQVDEVQDINRVQFELIRRYIGEKMNVLAVGDLDQAIYSWRGANSQFAEGFPEHFPGTVVFRIETNYRSTPQILKPASNLISKNNRRYAISLKTPRDDGEGIVCKCFPFAQDEARWIVMQAESLHKKSKVPYGGMSVLYRVGYQSRALEDEFRRRAIPYKLVGGVSFYDREEVKSGLAYLNLLANDKNSSALERVVIAPKRGLGEKNLATIESYMGKMKCGAIQAMKECELNGKLKRISSNLATVFESASAIKGLRDQAEFLFTKSDFLAYIAQRDVAEGDGYSHDSPRTGNVSELLLTLKMHEESCGEKASLSSFLQQISILTNIDMSEETDKVTLSTMHAAKGLEWDCVFSSGLRDGMVPHQRSLDEGGEEEERRLFYVSMTRAKNRLFLTASSCQGGRSMERSPLSRFIKEAGVIEEMSYDESGSENGQYSNI
jgi:DNA helicase-2/ATP-dependent DNA helicase PcrA